MQQKNFEEGQPAMDALSLEKDGEKNKGVGVLWQEISLQYLEQQLSVPTNTYSFAFCYHAREEYL